MKFLKVKFVYCIIAIIIITKYIGFLAFPFLGVDGPWSLSQTYSYINGIKDRSVFAHDFLGNIFTVHLIDFMYSIWFKIFNLSTYSFISLEFCIIILTLIVWGYLAHLCKNSRTLFYLLMLGYVISPYVYGFRPENITILTVSLVLLAFLIRLSENLKIVIVSALCVICGLVHHIGGLICVILVLYYYCFEKKKYINLLKVCVVSVVFSFLFTSGEIINYLLLPLKFKSEVDNHLSGINFSNILKYLIYSGPIPVVVLILGRKLLSKKDVVFLLLMLLLLSFLGRSYYVVYLYVIVIFLIVIRNSNLLSSVLVNKRVSHFLVIPSILYSFVFLFFIPIVLTASSPDTNSNWRKVIAKTRKETIMWDSHCKYFVPSQLSLEVANKTNARLIYPFMLHNDGIQKVTNLIFYVNTKDQIAWLHKNFDTKNKKIIIEEIVPETPGNIIISSIYKFKILRQKPFGLWKISFSEQ